jgi:Putative Actinobacterial Holin-X, holin superfamily III
LPGGNGQPDNLATAVSEISDRMALLVREEIELAKAEVARKVKTFRLGIAGFAIAAVFALLLIPFALLTLAWGLNSLLSSEWLGFLIVSVLLIVGMIGAAFFGLRKIKKGVPAPTMAIDEAKKIRATVSSKPEGRP